MTAGLATLGYKKFTEGLQEKVRTLIGTVLPEEAINTMISNELDRLMKEQIPKIVEEQIKAKIVESTKKVLEGPEYNSMWDGYGNRVASDTVTKLITENSGVLISALMGGIVQGAATHLANELRNNRICY